MNIWSFKIRKLLAIFVLLVLLSSLSFSIMAPVHAQAPKTVYVAINVDTEMYIPPDNHTDPWVGSSNPHPTADMRIFSRTTPSNVAAVFNASFRDANRDSYGNSSFKTTWFCQMDYVMSQSNFVWADGSPAGVSGYTAVSDLLTNIWGPEIANYGDSIEYHHHFLTYDGTWERHNSGPDEIYPDYQELALNHMILDRNFYPSAFRAGYWIMPPALSSWLDNSVPLDYTPLYGLPFYPTNPTGGRYQVATRYEATLSDVDLSFAQAESSGKAVYSDVIHSWESMANEITSLQGYLQTEHAKYPDVNFKYVTAREAVQQYFAYTDLTAPMFTITPAGSSYTITSSEPLWQNNPYVALKYADGTYRHGTAISAGTNMWTVTPPTQDITEEQVAIGTATANASSSQAGYPPGQAIDGIESTANYWGTNSTVNPLPQSITVDLQSSYSINGITTHFWDGDSRIFTYQIQVSGDGASWTTVVPSKQGSGVVTDIFADTSARYVKTTVIGNSANMGAQIEEMRIYSKTIIPISSSVTEIGVGASDLNFNTNTQTMNVLQRSLTVSSAHGSPSPSVGVHSYANGTSVTASVPSPVTEGNLVWTCTGWTGTGSVPATGSKATMTFPINSNSSITWNWTSAPANFTITVTQGINGMITPGTIAINYGGSQNFTVTPNTGYHIGSITVDGSPVNVTSPIRQKVSFTNVQTNHTITATFVQNTFAVSGTKGWYWTNATLVNSVAVGDVDGDAQTETITGGSFNDGTRNVAQLIVWNSSSLVAERIQCWYWTGNTTINSVAVGDVNSDGKPEIVTGGTFYDGQRNVAQLIVWNATNLVAEKVTTWYWTNNTVINSIAIGDVDGDGQTEIVTGGSFFDDTRNVAQLVVWTGTNLAVDKLTTWYWTGNTVINSIAIGDVDGDGQTEIVTGGSFFDDTRNVAQLVVWTGTNLAVDKLTTWYWTGNTVINSIAIGDVDGDGQTEIVTGGSFFDDTRNVAQLVVWTGTNLAVDKLTTWYWTGNTVINSIAIGDVNSDGQAEIVTGGKFNDNTRDIAQLIIWSGSNIAFENIQSWYWTSNTTINSVAIGDINADFSNEIITGGAFYDGTRSNSQLTVWGMS